MPDTCDMDGCDDPPATTDVDYCCLEHEIEDNFK